METKTKLVKAVKDYFFTLALAVTFIGFSAFKAAEGKRQTNHYKLVGNEYRMVDLSSGTCQPTTPNTCLWEIESDELTIPQNEAQNPQPYQQGEFDGDFVTE